MRGILVAIGFLAGIGFAAVSDRVFTKKPHDNSTEPSYSLAAQPVVVPDETTQTIEDAISRPRPIVIGGTFLDARREVLEYQQQSARKGNAQAQYAMALRYLGGIDVPQNDTLAMYYLEDARNGGEVRARDKITEVLRIKRKAEEKRREHRELAFLAELRKFEDQ